MLLAVFSIIFIQLISLCSGIYDFQNDFILVNRQKRYGESPSFDAKELDFYSFIQKEMAN